MSGRVAGLGEAFRKRGGVGVWSLLALLGFALVEVADLYARSAAVPATADWEAAAQLVREQLQPRDLVVAAPDWSDPLLRLQLGDRMSFAMAGRADLAPFERLWALSIRGARPSEAPAGEPALRRAFGGVEVLRWELGPSPVLYDFVAELSRARVTLGERPCPLTQVPAPRGGGLGQGSMPPRERFVCDPRRAFLHVGTTILEDLSLRPRYCIWQHPAGKTPLTVTFDDVPLGERFVLYGGLYYEDERMREHAPVRARVLIDGKPAGELLHRDGDGWKQLVLETAAGARRGQVAIEVTSDNPRKRSFCWAASSRGPGR